MRISGFTFVRNAIDLYYPILESIGSVLPICDEFVIAAGDSTDGTTELLRGIDSPKIKIIETVWDRSRFDKGASNAHQTNIALNACTGDWCLYVQADEVVHEDDLDPLVERMRLYLDDPRVEGLLFEYLHFFADYDHIQASHSWYRREVRVVRNGRGIQSWKSAQGFRRHGGKIRVAHANARIFHYGWVRPPVLMTRKTRALKTVHHGEEGARAATPDINKPFDFGMLRGRRPYDGTHPEIMTERIAEYDWTVEPSSNPHKHDRTSQRALSFVENRLTGFRLGEHRNYILLPG